MTSIWTSDGQLATFGDLSFEGIIVATFRLTCGVIHYSYISLNTGLYPSGSHQVEFLPAPCGTLVSSVAFVGNKMCYKNSLLKIMQHDYRPTFETEKIKVPKSTFLIKMT